MQSLAEINALYPSHGKTSCSDADPCNADVNGCHRCTALALQDADRFRKLAGLIQPRAARMAPIQFSANIAAGCIDWSEAVNPEALRAWVDAQDASLEAGALPLTVETVRSFLSTVLTVKRENLDGWMEYLAERINEVCEAIGEDDRFAYNQRRGAILPAKR